MNHAQQLFQITDQTFDPSAPPPDITDYSIRLAARGLLVNSATNQVALIHISKSHYYKLPVGGVEPDETIEQGFHREILEETGCQCQILDQGPVVLEFRQQFKLLQISYTFQAQVVGEPGKVTFEPDEIAEGSELIWAPKHQALELMATNESSGYEDKFINLRDTSIIHHFTQHSTY